MFSRLAIVKIIKDRKRDPAAAAAQDASISNLPQRLINKTNINI